MNKQINLFAIRIKGTDLFKCSRHDLFGTYEDAMQSGCYYNQAENAEKIVKATMNSLKKNPYARFAMDIDGEIKHFSMHKDLVDSMEKLKSTKEYYEIQFRKIELEVVTLSLTLA